MSLSLIEHRYIKSRIRFILNYHRQQRDNDRLNRKARRRNPSHLVTDSNQRACDLDSIIYTLTKLASDLHLLGPNMILREIYYYNDLRDNVDNPSAKQP